MSAPESLDVQVLHHRQKGIAVRGSIVRLLPRAVPRSVDLSIMVDIGKGLVDLHFILPPNQAGQMIDMLQEALTLIGGREQ